VTERTDVIDTVADLLRAIPTGHPLRIGIDGITAAGKTTFANELAETLRARGRTVLRTSMDGFHNPRAIRYRQGRESVDGYYEDAYDFVALRRALLDPLGPVGDRRYRAAVYDLATDEAIDQPPTLAEDDLVVIVDGTFLQRRDLNGAWDAVIYLRADFAIAGERGARRDTELLGTYDNARRLFDVRYHAAGRRYLDEVDPERAADIVVDRDDPLHPKITRIAEELTTVQPHLRRSRAFFGARAARWEDRFPDDDAAYAAAVAELAPRTGGVVIDLGCGTGRALLHLRNAIGPGGTVLGADVTPEMLHVTAQKGRADGATLMIVDAAYLPFADASIDAIFAAGLVTHVADPAKLLRRLADLAKPHARLALFHPVGRAALARRHGNTLRPDELLDPSVLPGVLAATGWRLESIDDGEDRYLALARVAGEK
jgi:uridine kinase